MASIDDLRRHQTALRDDLVSLGVPLYSSASNDPQSIWHSIRSGVGSSIYVHLPPHQERRSDIRSKIKTQFAKRLMAALASASENVFKSELTGLQSCIEAESNFLRAVDPNRPRAGRWPTVILEHSDDIVGILKQTTVGEASILGLGQVLGLHEGIIAGFPGNQLLHPAIATYQAAAEHNSDIGVAVIPLEAVTRIVGAPIATRGSSFILDDTILQDFNNVRDPSRPGLVDLSEMKEKAKRLVGGGKREYQARRIGEEALLKLEQRRSAA